MRREEGIQSPSSMSTNAECLVVFLLLGDVEIQKLFWVLFGWKVLQELKVSNVVLKR